MIKIDVKEKNKRISEVLIKGHANYDISGQDIICASVSSIVITSINMIITFDQDSITYEEKDGYIKINTLKTDDITNKILINMINRLNELVSKYPKNINMKRGE